MNQMKDQSRETNRFQCPMCNQTFQTDEELQIHNRAYHQGKSGNIGSGAEHQFPGTARNPGTERNPNMDRNREAQDQRREPDSRQQDDDAERREQPRKRAAS
jgi:hypothetical protein